MKIHFRRLQTSEPGITEIVCAKCHAKFEPDTTRLELAQHWLQCQKEQG